VFVCDTYHGNTDETEPKAEEIERVVLTREDVRRSRVRAETETGKEVGVVLDRRLRDGDIVYDEEVAVVVELEGVEAFAVELDGLTPTEAAELGHDLGNSHHEMAVEDSIAYVPVTEDTRRRLGELPDCTGVRRVEVEPSVFDGDGGGEDPGHTHPTVHGHDHSHEDSTEEAE
jgi:urease accessory protein